MRAAALRFTASVDGLSPHTIALLLAVGFALGTFPMYGCPTVFCAVAALVLRMNLPALQVVNQLTTPLQIALLIPFMQVGSRIVGSPATFKLGAAALQAVAGWFCICIPLGFFLYFVMLFFLRRCRPVWPLPSDCASIPTLR